MLTKFKFHFLILSCVAFSMQGFANQQEAAKFVQTECAVSYTDGCVVPVPGLSNDPVGAEYSNNKCVEISAVSNVKVDGSRYFKDLKSCNDRYKDVKFGDYFEFASNVCTKKNGSHVVNNSTIFSNETDCKKLIKAEVYSDADFAAQGTDAKKKSYCNKFSDRRMKSGNCVEKSGFGKAMGSAGSFLGEKISEVSLSDVSSIADDVGVKDGAKRKLTLRRNPDQFFREYCDEPALDNDCMSIIKKPGKEAIYLEKICEGDAVKTPECEAKFMALHKDNAKAKYIAEVCEDSPVDKLKCRQYYKQVKGAEKFYIDLCSDEKEKEPGCKPDAIMADATLIPAVKKSVFEQIHCGEDVENRDKRCPKIVEEKEEDAEESEDEDSDEEESDEEF
jgi:hypothetical protein